jgi:hypothetical protein
MENKHIPIETEIGVLRGRDAIMLHDIELNVTDQIDAVERSQIETV